MLYSALCIDNTQYFEKGTIRVRISAYYNNPNVVDGNTVGVDDLSTDENLRDQGSIGDIDPTVLHEDFEALVFTPMGGGKNYGMFYLPRINEKGVVTFLDGDFGKPLWMGSYFAPQRDSDFNVESVNIPNEDPSKEGDDTDGAEGGSFNSDLDDNLKGDSRTIVLRTKYTTPDSADNMNWENVSSENLVALDNKKVRVRHFTEWEDGSQQKYQEALIYKDSDNDDKETVQLEVNNLKDGKSGTMKLTEDGFKVEVTDGDNSTIFELNLEETGINFTDQYGNVIKGDENGITMKTDTDNTVVVDDSKEIHLLGDADTMVLYSDLKDIIEKLASHIHISSVPTSPPLDSSLAPLEPQLTNPKINMEATKVKSEH